MEFVRRGFQNILKYKVFFCCNSSIEIRVFFSPCGQTDRQSNMAKIIFVLGQFFRTSLKNGIHKALRTSIVELRVRPDIVSNLMYIGPSIIVLVEE